MCAWCADRPQKHTGVVETASLDTDWSHNPALAANNHPHMHMYTDSVSTSQTAQQTCGETSYVQLPN